MIHATATTALALAFTAALAARSADGALASVPTRSVKAGKAPTQPPLVPRPHGLADGYVGGSVSDTIEPFDLEALTSGPTIDLPGTGTPHHAVVSPDGAYVWVTHPGTIDDVKVVDRATDSVVQRILIGSYTVGLAFTDDSVYAVVTSRDATNATVIAASLFVPSATTPLPGMPGNVAMDPATGKLYVVEWNGPRIFELDRYGISFLREANVGTSLWNLVASPDCNGLYVLDRGANLLRVIDRTTLAQTRSVAVGTDPAGIDVTRDGRTIVVACEDSHDVWLVDTTTWTTRTVRLDTTADPRDVDIDDARRRAYVAAGTGLGGDLVYAIDLDGVELPVSFDAAGSNANVVAVQAQTTSADLGGAVADQDEDGRLAACDNCPDVANPGQEDADGDGVGDACEIIATCDEPSALDAAPGVEPLRVSKEPPDMLRLAWQAMPAQLAAVYVGTIESLHVGGAYDHREVGACSVSAPSLSLASPVADAYMLVVGACGTTESSYGRDSAGDERPPGSPRCP